MYIHVLTVEDLIINNLVIQCHCKQIWKIHVACLCEVDDIDDMSSLQKLFCIHSKSVHTTRLMIYL